MFPVTRFGGDIWRTMDSSSTPDTPDNCLHIRRGFYMLGLRKQQPFRISGIFAGLAGILYYTVLEKPGRLTTGLVAQ